MSEWDGREAARAKCQWHGTTARMEYGWSVEWAVPILLLNHPKWVSQEIALFVFGRCGQKPYNDGECRKRAQCVDADDNAVPQQHHSSHGALTSVATIPIPTSSAARFAASPATLKWRGYLRTPAVTHASFQTLRSHSNLSAPFPPTPAAVAATTF